MKRLLFLVTSGAIFFASCKKNAIVQQEMQATQSFEFCAVKETPKGIKTINDRHLPQIGANNASTARFIIFVMFDGYNYLGGAWGSAMTFPASGLDSTGRAAVLAQMKEDYETVYNSVVTTSQTLWDSSSVGHRTRVVVTANSAWYPGVGGISFIGSIVSGFEEPCFVFSDALSYNADKIGLAGSHEAGHTVGLYHQAVWTFNPCTLVSAYDAGHGGSVIGWGPVMGAPYNIGLRTWANGPTSTSDNTGCPVYQDEFSAINTVMSYNADIDPNDRSQPAGSYRVLAKNSGIDGVLNQSGDVDVIKLSNYSILPTIHFRMYTYGNADLIVKFYNNSGTLRATIDPTGQVDIPSTDMKLLGMQNGFVVISATSSNTNVPNPNFLTGKWTAYLSN